MTASGPEKEVQWEFTFFCLFFQNKPNENPQLIEPVTGYLALVFRKLWPKKIINSSPLEIYQGY